MVGGCGEIAGKLGGWVAELMGACWKAGRLLEAAGRQLGGCWEPAG